MNLLILTNYFISPIQIADAWRSWD